MLLWKGFPKITILENIAEESIKIECWHSDMTFRPHPPMATLLRSKAIPEKGADTLWSSLTAAYDGLSLQMQTFLSELTAVHDFSNGFRESLVEPGGSERLAHAVADNPPVSHPIIRIHPEHHKKMVFVNPFYNTY